METLCDIVKRTYTLAEWATSPDMEILKYDRNIMHMQYNQNLTSVQNWNAIILQNGNLIDYKRSKKNFSDNTVDATSYANVYDDTGKLDETTRNCPTAYSWIGDRILAMRAWYQARKRKRKNIEIDAKKILLAYQIVDPKYVSSWTSPRGQQIYQARTDDCEIMLSATCAPASYMRHYGTRYEFTPNEYDIVLNLMRRAHDACR